MEKERQQALEWFVQFANMNLNELRPGDKAKLLVESEEYLFPTKEEVRDVPRWPDEIKQRMGVLAEMTWAFKRRPQKDSEEYWSLILGLQNFVNRTLERLVKIHNPKIWAESVMVRSGGDPGKFTFSYMPLVPSQNRYLETKLNLLLNGLPRSSLQRCPAPKCQKFFVNVSRRKKRFCSPRCMWRFNAEKRRKDNPEAYRKYQKEVMADKYRTDKGLKPKKFYKSKKRKED